MVAAPAIQEILATLLINLPAVFVRLATQPILEILVITAILATKEVVIIVVVTQVLATLAVTNSTAILAVPEILED
jgi:hypothetical protein